jgi:hypothetical protein
MGVNVHAEMAARHALPLERQAASKQITDAELWFTGHPDPEQEKWRAARGLPETASDLLTEAMVAQARCAELERFLGVMVDAHEACEVTALAMAAAEATLYLGRDPQEVR